MEAVKERFAGLGRRLVAYTVITIAVIILLRIVLGAVIGFVHMLIFIALLVFAVYAIAWAMRFKRDA